LLEEAAAAIKAIEDAAKKEKADADARALEEQQRLQLEAE
jgi:hypothetical protein